MRTPPLKRTIRQKVQRKAKAIVRLARLKLVDWRRKRHKPNKKPRIRFSREQLARPTTVYFGRKPKKPPLMKRGEKH